MSNPKRPIASPRRTTDVKQQGAKPAETVQEPPKRGRARGNPAVAREAATVRRRFIYERIKQQTRVSIAEISEHFGLTSRDSIKDDVHFFTKHGIPFKLVALDDELVIMDEGVGPSLGGVMRQALHIVEKKTVAKLANALITGRKLKMPGALSTDAQQEILGCLSSQANDVGMKLADYWRETSRLISLDSSTTNEQVASFLTKLEIPSTDSNLSYLSVCTNSRTIFNQIGNPNVPIRAIVTGGQQRGRSVTLAGAMTEFFLRESVLLHFGIAFVSATGVDVATGHCVAETQEDMLVKQQFLSKGVTRVIIVDNTKLKKPLQAGFPFASLNRKQVDILITNAPLNLESFRLMANQSGRSATSEEMALQADVIEKFDGYIEDIRRRDVAVLVATNDLTKAIEPEKGYMKDVVVRVPFSDAEKTTLHIR